MKFRASVLAGDDRQMRRDRAVAAVQRYRTRQRAHGLKLVRLWVPDPQAPGFAEEARRQAQLLVGAPEEAEALDFIEQVADWDDVER